MTRPPAGDGASRDAPHPEGFPRLYAVAKWTVVLALALLTLAAAAFWVVLLGGFAAGGFRATEPRRQGDVPTALTPECAWPYRVDEPGAEAVCRMFRQLTPEQREQVLRARR